MTDRAVSGTVEDRPTAPPTGHHRAPRLHVDASLAAGASIDLPPDQAHYLVAVMRLKTGATARLFNGHDGEWLATVEETGKRRCRLACVEALRPQTGLPDIHYLFAPLKHARIDYVAQKATEMGASVLQPVLTGRTVAQRVKTERLRANAVEAAEQCNLLAIPEIRDPAPLDRLLDGWDTERRLIYCDEAAPLASPLDALRAVPKGPLALLIGPEGGFTEAEQRRLRALDHVTAISLGPRVMRADTAAVAALAVVQATLGDWH